MEPYQVIKSHRPGRADINFWTGRFSPGPTPWLGMLPRQQLTLIRPQSVNKQNSAVTIVNRFFSMNLLTVSLFRLYF